MFGSEIWPQTSHSPIVTLLLLVASVFAVSSTKTHSTISQHHPALKPYHQFVHGLNSLLVWFQHRVWLADDAVCNNITPCPIGAKKVGLEGAFFTSSRHLLAQPWQKASSTCTVLVWCCGGCGTGTILVAAFAAVAKMSVWYINVNDALCTKLPNRYY
jgi:hypothetical protein